MSSLNSLFFLALGASSIVAANPLVSRQTGANKLSCVNNANNGTIFASQNGTPYQLLCNTDYINGDLSNQKVDTIDDCVKACDNTKDCVTVVYDNSQNCYLKQQLVTRRDSDHTTTAKRVIIPDLCNPDQLNNRQYFTSSGFFQVYCRGDYLYGDLGAFDTKNLDSCIGNCSVTTRCIGATFHDERCFMKSRLVRGQRSDGASSGIRAIDCIRGASTWNNTIYPTPDSTFFKIQCGQQYKGFEYKTIPTLSFENCIDACDNEGQCDNVAWTGGACFLKRGKGVLQSGGAQRLTFTAARTDEQPQ